MLRVRHTIHQFVRGPGLTLVFAHKSGSGNRTVAFGDEDVLALAVLALDPAQCPDFLATERMTNST